MSIFMAIPDAASAPRHQTGWTGLIALLFDPRETQDTAGVAPAATPNADVSKS